MRYCCGRIAQHPCALGAARCLVRTRLVRGSRSCRKPAGVFCGTDVTCPANDDPTAENWVDGKGASESSVQLSACPVLASKVKFLTLLA